MKTSYLKFFSGQLVILNESIICEEIFFDKGHIFSIISFPPKTTKNKRQYFVYGKDRDNKIIRCEIDQIIHL